MTPLPITGRTGQEIGYRQGLRSTRGKSPWTTGAN